MDSERLLTLLMRAGDVLAFPFVVSDETATYQPRTAPWRFGPSDPQKAVSGTDFLTFAPI